LYVLGVTGGTFTGNTITPASDATGISFSGANANVTVTNNVITGGARGVRIEDAGYFGAAGGNTNITVNRNSLATNSEYGIGNLSGYTGSVDGTCNWWGAANGPGPVGPGAGSPVTANVTFASWLTSSDLVNGLCNGPLPSTVKVTIDKYIDGVQATSVNANNSSFPMKTTFSATNIGSGTDVPFSIGPVGFNSPNPYEAITSDMASGANYTASEVTGGAVVGADCTTGQPYALVGYKSGDTLALAQAAATSTSAPSFTGLTSDKLVLVLNKICPLPQPQVHIFKYVDGVQATDTNANSAVFPMQTTFNSPNLGSVTNVPFTLSPIGWGPTDDAYEASFVGSDAGADYAANEVLSTPVVGASCDGAHTFRLVGYSTGATLAAAQAGTVSLTIPSFTNLQSDKYVIVWNVTCPTTGSVKIEKNALGGNGTFNFTSTIPGHANFSITTVGGVGSTTFTGVNPGAYTVTEIVPAGWTQTDSECKSSGVVVTTGGAATCVITNSKNPKLGVIRGTKYEDRDGSGKLKDSDHHRLAGWTIYLDTNNNAALDSGEPTSVTDSHGNYRFINLVAGTYYVREVLQPGWTQTVPGTGVYTVILGAGKIVKKNFGNFKPGAVSGMKFNDLNGNHRKDAGELGLAGWTITLKKLGNGPTATTTTDVNGNYAFTNLAAGSYKLAEVMQPTWRQTLHPNSIVIRSSSNLINKNFGNTQKPKSNDDRDDDDRYRN
jgi:SdrD B-like domain